MKIHEHQILSLLWDYLKKKDKKCYLFHNLYYFYDNSNELDLLMYDKNGYSVEKEIKSSLQDYKEDSMKEVKHQLLAERSEECPNRFYYIMPKDTVPLEDIPDYAGLIEFNFNKYGECKFTRKRIAPLLHKKLTDVRDLFKKSHFKYEKWIEAELKDERKRIKKTLINEGSAIVKPKNVRKSARTPKPKGKGITRRRRGRGRRNRTKSNG